MNQTQDKGLGVITWKSYMPLIVIISVIFVTALVFNIVDIFNGEFIPQKFIGLFMIGFFLAFSTFKLIDLPGFAKGYQTYDLLASRAPWYGYFYPFIELSFGLLMILIPFSKTLLIVEIIVMLFSGLGVVIKLAKKEEFTCACLGTFLKIPLTKVTLVEDFGMAGLAAVMLLLS
ncbi:MAG: MauE/DoxX family redox-associated membrane protein [bacterium]